MLGIPLGLLYSNAGEWVIHKHVLHGVGRKRDSFWSFHWLEHHRASRLNGFRDADYERPVFENHADENGKVVLNAQGKEALALIATGLAHAPLFPIAPFFTGTVMYALINYYRKHKKSHLDPEWAREHLPWHYDHHMAPNQDANWCVTRPWFDELMGTREPYVGTERERRDRERAARREARREEKRAARERAA